MLIHDAYKVGYYWEKIAGSEHQGKCNSCGVTETMQHILTQCREPGQSQVWELASELWRLKTGSDLKPTMGEIMACGAVEISDPGESRLFRIVVAESAHLVWKLRNKRVCQARVNDSEPKPDTARGDLFGRMCIGAFPRTVLSCQAGFAVLGHF